MSSIRNAPEAQVPVFRGVSKEKMETLKQKDPALVEAAEQMEALFIDQLFQAMRNSVPESEFSLENHATKIYKSMLDTELAKNAAQAHSLGLSELLVAHLESQRYPRDGSVQSYKEEDIAIEKARDNTENTKSTWRYK